MNKYFQCGDNLLSYFPIVFKVIFLAIFVPMTFLSSCKDQKKNNISVVNKDVYYTCSMHPQVHEEHPGNCPICGMKLIAVSKTTSGATIQVHLNPEQIRLGNIQIDTVGTASIGDKLVLTGTLNFNEDKLAK